MTTYMAPPEGSTITKTAAIKPAPDGSTITKTAPVPGTYGVQKPEFRPFKGAPVNGQASTSPGVAQSAFTPQNNLIGTQFSPIASQRLGQAQGYTNQAAQQYANAPISPFGQQISGLMGPAEVGSFSFGGDTTGVRGQAVSQLAHIMNTMPDRAKLGADTLALLEERSQPGWDRMLRSVGQRASALGRVGAGMTTNDLTDVASQRERYLDQSRRELATEAAQQSLQDQYLKLQAGQGLMGAMGGLDLGAGGINQGYDQMRLSERNNAFNRMMDYEDSLFGRSRARLGDLSAYERGVSGDERMNRDEMRGERGYQYGLERDALGDRERQFGMEEASQQNAFNRALQMAQLGYGTNPSGAYAAQGQQMGAQAQGNLDAYGPLFMEWARSRNRRPAGGSGPTTYDSPDYTDASTY